ncbi:NIF family HAD-type phosphatase [Novipirellula sp. SH528]|uniref:NIF family HAD-type phosphatase n=1 Tax=Novipirellula sp. SH528 TaxID=3454466 RepID=UPI003F9EE6F4
MQPLTTIALDLEGTLISNAVSQFPRPGLNAFLQFCRDNFKNVYIYTAVPDSTCVPIIQTLIDDDFAPAWLADISFVQWDRSVKDLTNVPNCDPDACLLLDDNCDYVVDSQIDQWIAIDKFQSPYPDTDSELARVQNVISERLSKGKP